MIQYRKAGTLRYFQKVSHTLALTGLTDIMPSALTLGGWQGRHRRRSGMKTMK